MIFKIPYLISKHFCLPLFEFIIFHFLFILHSIRRFLLFRTFHFSFIQFPTFQFSNFSISLLLHISLLHICIYLLPFPVHYNSHYSFSTLHIKYANFIFYATTLHLRFTINLFLPQSQSQLEITFNRYQTCLYPQTRK